MKPVQRKDSTSQSCSCTSCLYKSESEQPSIRKYIAHGSRIDRLYYGKYIPLRERKLLNRLVRTRAVYDDLRARLISDSTLSLDKNADLRPRKHHHAIKTLNSTEKSGAILEIVDIIDRGGATNPKKISECCSCCSCSSKVNILERDKKEHKHKRAYNRRFEGEYGQRAQHGQREQYGQKAQYGQRAQYEHRAQYSEKVLGRSAERYDKKGVRFKAKRIRSEPCTCTFKFSGLIKKHSKALVSKTRAVPLEPARTMEDLYVVEDSALQSLAKTSYHKIKDLQSKLECACNIKQNLQLGTKKSLEQLKQAKDKLKANIETGVRKSLQAVKTLQQKDKAFEYVEYPRDETNFKIKKDSIVKFKDYLKRKEIMKDWECDLECIPDTCEPKECFKMLKLRRLHKRLSAGYDKRPRDRKHTVKYETFRREVNVGETPLRKSNSSVQAGQLAMTTATHIQKQKPMLRGEGGNEIMGKRLIIETREIKKEKKRGVRHGVKNRTHLEQIAKKSVESSPLTTSHVKHNVKGFQGGVVRKRDLNYVKKDKFHTGGHQAMRYGSSFNIGRKIKTKLDSRSSTRSSLPSGLHLSDKRVRQHKHTHKKVLSHHKGSQIVLEPPPRSPKQLKVYPKRHDDKFIGKKLEYGAIPIVKQVSSIKTNTGFGTKSVPSLIQTMGAVDQNVVSPVPRKQAVRIESTFSFNVEFSKKNNQNVVKTPSIKEHTHNIGTHAPREVKVPIIKESKKAPRKIRSYATLKKKGSLPKARYMQAKTNLLKCICNFKSNLNKFKGTKKRTRTSTTGTVASIITENNPIMIDKHVETKKRNLVVFPKAYQLHPNECEPGICIPGECDPLYCKKLLEQRNKLKMYNRGSYTRSRQTKSTSSLVPKHFRPRITKNVQSTLVSTKLTTTSTPRRYKEGFSLEQTKQDNIIGIPQRQAVRIGSSFSFNIEFYKDKQALTDGNVEHVRNVPPDLKYKKKKVKDGGYQENNKNNKSIFAQVINMDEYIGPSLKRCFCTLKLYKNKNIKKKKNKEHSMLTANTQTFGGVVPVIETVHRGTKTKWRHTNELLPFECEPNFCIPGECDPYTCLERIKNRELHVRDYGVYTGKPKMTSISSFTENLYTRSTAMLAQPKLYRKGTYMKDWYNRVSDGRPREVIINTSGSGETYDSVNSKQAVRIGSSFNFSIEFSKQLPQTLTLTKQAKRDKISKEYKKMYRDKNIKVTKGRVHKTDVDTQSIEPKKKHKSFLVRPMLKRCFCTLNLQKKTIQQFRKGNARWVPGNQHLTPKIYSVSRAMATRTGMISHHNFGSQDEMLQLIRSNKMISISTSSFLFKKFATTSISKYKTLKLFPMLEVPLNLKQPIKINSNLSVEIEFIREFNFNNEFGLDHRTITKPLKSFSYGYVNEQPLDHIHRQPSLTVNSQKKITGISQYLERCFYTMNVQISPAEVPTQKKKFGHKLKPYECEPGICIPGECDPYVCQKAIMKRLMRNVHKGSSTESANKSISSYTTNTGSGSRSTQYGRQSHSRESKPDKYTTQHHHDMGHKQAVRVGSSFSFDVQFSKNSSQLPGSRIKHIYSSSSTRSKGAQGKNVRYGKDRHAQSTTSSAHKGSNYAPRVKRCFCTLKLQKKGKKYRENAKLNVYPKINTPSITSRSMKVGTPNYKYHAPKHYTYNLKPYECEPGICIPVQCNPYECLERIKKRTDFGVGTTPHGEKSISSMTSEGRHIKRKLQTHGIDMRHKKTYKKDRSKDTNSITKKNLNRRKVTNSMSSSVTERHSRQAVRIGSSFSFNVEFYKDTPRVSENKEINNVEKTIRTHSQLRQKNPAREIRYKKHLKGSLSQSSRDLSHRNTQIDAPRNQMATMTSFSKRCFCTAKLQGIQIPEKQNTPSPTFMQKCFCLLGLRNKQKKDNEPAEIQSETANKRTNTNFRTKIHLPPLEPYECEPGTCIPGQCDPYLCDKIIQQRLTKHYSKSSATESVNTQSISSGFGYSRGQKDRKTQARDKKHKNNLKDKSKPKYINNRLPTKYSNEIININKNNVNENKRLVRIGSNFSFNIEFYKENLDSKETKEKIKEIKTVPNSYATRKTKPELKHMTGTRSIGPTIRTTDAQTDEKKMKAFGVNPLLKRCFCTLKLLKNPDRIQDINKIDTKTVVMKSVETQSHKMLNEKPIRNNFRGNEALLPYECEPFVCVPGKCDPIECLERIKRRNLHTKNFGTFTEYPERKSVGSVFSRTTKDKHLQSKYRGTRPKSTQKTNYVEKIRQRESERESDRSRQAVRIGSNFSFNIEFCKSDGNDGPVIVKNPSLENLNLKQKTKSPKKYHTKSQPSYVGHNVHSQASRKMESTETGMPTLKRCFCTLQLKDKNVNKVIKTKSEHSTVGAFLKKCMCVLKINKTGKLQNVPPPPAIKYEIKGTSTYSQSPRLYKVVKPITLQSYECEPNVCIPGECDPYECLKRIQKIQLRDIGTTYKRNVRNFATNSIKLPFSRNTEAQYHRKQRSHSQGTSFPANRRQHSHETSSYTPHSYKQDSSSRQAVRIGSNFSFNIEFFKEKGDKPHSSYKELKVEKVPKMSTRSEKLRARPIDSDSIGTNTHERQYMTSAVNTVPRRCFCTLKLLNNPNFLKSEVKPLPPLKPPPMTTEDKMTATKNKYTIPHELGVYECPPLMCIPGECDPYDCLNKLNRRERKYRNVGTRAGKTSIASVGNTSQLKTHGNQSTSRKRNFKTYTPRSEPQSVILKSPRMAPNVNRQNKRAVRIGSNFNFNIDFFKERFQPAIIRSPRIVRARNKEDLKSYLNKNVTANTGKFRRHDSQADGIITRDQASDAGNMLKRCFCTLQLQNSSRQGKILHKNVIPPGINVNYPQVVTVGRVTVEPFNKKLPKAQQVGNTNLSSQDRRCKTTKQTKVSNNLRTVATKIDKKHLQNKHLVEPPCDPSSCPGYRNQDPLTRKTRNDMHTILPYTRSKFNKKESKTLVSDKDKLQRILNQNQTKLETRDKLMFPKGKRLTYKKSDKSIPTHLLDKKSCLNNSILCRCARLFSKRNTDLSNSQNNQKNIDKPRNEQFKVVLKPKSLKSGANGGEACPCPGNTRESRKKYSKLQYGDMETTKTKIDKQSRNIEHSKSSSKNQKMKVTFADNSTKYSSSMTKERRNTIQHHGSSKGSKLCSSCSMNDCPLQCPNYKNDNKPGVFHMLTNCLTNCHNKRVTYSESADNCQYCERCKKKLEAVEINKGAGDKASIQKSEKLLSQKKDHSDQLNKQLHKSSQQKGRAATCPCDKNKKLFVMQVDAVNYDIVNKNELLQKVHGDKDQFGGHRDYTSPASKFEGAKITVPATGIPKIIGATGKTLVGRSPTGISGPCVCGSLKCAVESKRIKGRSKRRDEIKPCVCGSIICAKETRRIKKLRKQNVCTCQDEMDKRRAEKEIYRKADLHRRLRMQQEKDEIERRKRIKRNALLEKKVKKYKDASDCFLAVDSLIDIGKLGVSTVGNVLSTTAKAAYDPAVAIERMKCKKVRPESVLQLLEKRYMESDAASTTKRVKLRCSFMKKVQAAKRKLEENPVTHFLMHVTDKNPKTRKFKRKPKKRFREPLDFQCSLYMASLRKRPYLCIYYKCPWFYPHFVTMLNVWKQFTDIILFLLAAVVWSPCILCMEGCRAMMCCVFCTG